MKNLFNRIFPYFEINNFGKVAKAFLTILVVLTLISTLSFTTNFMILLTNGYQGELVTWLFLACAILYIAFYVFLVKSVKNRDNVMLVISQVAIISAFVLAQGLFYGLIAGLLWTIPLFYLKKSYMG
ncbi:MAG: hypothetical protein ACRC2K_00545 [Clostridium sp.]